MPVLTDLGSKKFCDSVYSRYYLCFKDVDLNVYETQTVTRDISVRVRDVWSDQILVTPPLVVLIPSVQTKVGLNIYLKKKSEEKDLN